MCRFDLQHYPSYIEQYGRTTMNKDLLTPHANGTDHVVVQIQKLLSQILPFHKLLQEEFHAAITNWLDIQNSSKKCATFSGIRKIPKWQT